MKSKENYSCLNPLRAYSFRAILLEAGIPSLLKPKSVVWPSVEPKIFQRLTGTYILFCFFPKAFQFVQAKYRVALFSRLSF